MTSKEAKELYSILGQLNLLETEDRITKVISPETCDLILKVAPLLKKWKKLLSTFKYKAGDIVSFSGQSMLVKRVYFDIDTMKEMSVKLVDYYGSVIEINAIDGELKKGKW